MYRSFGAEVTVIEALPRIAPLEDEEISKQLARFRRRGIRTSAGATVKEVKDLGDRVEVTYEAGETATASADVCLVASRPGTRHRRPRPRRCRRGARSGIREGGRTAADLRIARLGRGRRRRDAAAARPRRVHRGHRGRRAHLGPIGARDRLRGHSARDLLHPEVASVGLTQEQAVERGRDVVVEDLDMRAIGKANIVGEAAS